MEVHEGDQRWSRQAPHQAHHDENETGECNDKENMEVFSKHLQKVYNQQRPTFADAAKLIAQREVLHEIGECISWKEFNKAVMKLANDKSPEENGVPPNAFKCLDSENRQTIYQYICDFWGGEMDYEEWHTGLVKLLPKSGDLRNPNKWRGITLMDVCCMLQNLQHYTGRESLQAAQPAWDRASIRRDADEGMCQRPLLHQIIVAYETPAQSPIIHIMFVDLVKAYEDTVNHELLFQILERYGAPSQYVDAIRRLYNSVIVKISIGTEKAEISQTVGVRQGDNLSPVIFIFLMSACAESMQDELDARGMMERAKCRKVNLTNPNPNLPISPKTSKLERNLSSLISTTWMMEPSCLPQERA
jgi:truncated hemoglobin YjbI